MTITTSARVAAIRTAPRYPMHAPFDPSETYPEMAGAPIGSEPNEAYRAVRACLVELGYDADRYGSADWNPLGELIRPGETVVLKPNLVSHRNLGERAYGLTDTDSLVTHGSIIRAVVDYVALALKGTGRVIIGDCPIQGTDWASVCRLVSLPEIAESTKRRWPGISVDLRDYRLARAQTDGNRVSRRVVDETGRSEYVEVDLRDQSLLVPLMDENYSFGVAQYPRSRMRYAHAPERNLYLIPKDILNADVIINLPKLKSHMKAGITCALKNLVGINGHKDYLPHFRFGSPKTGGDEYPDGNFLWDLKWALLHREWEIDSGWKKLMYVQLARACGLALRRCGYPRNSGNVGGGGWHGNDTLWRTILDINRALLYFDPGTGGLSSRETSGRRYLNIVDGIIGGAKESPLAPTPVPSGIVLAGRNPVAVDTVAAALMGLDYRKLKQLTEAYLLRTHRLVAFSESEIRISGMPGISSVWDIYEQGAFDRFEPSAGYKGHVEFAAEAAVHCAA